MLRQIVALLLVSGCGFLGEPPYSGRRVADVAPWQDLGRLGVCDGTAHLGMPTAGFCEVAPARACRHDGDCHSRERCLCNACQPLRCDVPADCGAGYACNANVCEKTCTQTSDCAAGETCVDGRNVCRGGCSTDGDCQSSERCTPSGECAATACTDNTSCNCILQQKPAYLAHPAPLAENGGFTLWLERDGRIVRGVSPDGLEYLLGADLFAGQTPSVAAAQNGYLMVYAQGADLYRAVSSDGVSFTPDAAPLLAAAGEPSLVATSDGYSLYYTQNGNVLRATSGDGVTFLPSVVVLTPDQLVDPTLWRNVDRIAAPFAQALLDIGGRPFIRLWFAAHGQESGPAYNFDHFEEVPANFSIGEAASADGAMFTPYPFNPVFDRVELFLTHLDELDPALVAAGDTQYLYYRRGADMTSGLGVARSPAQPR